MYGCVSWPIKKAEHQRIHAFGLLVLEKTLERYLDGKDIQSVYPKGNKSWIFIKRTDAEAETPILWPLVVKNWLMGKDSDSGKDWRQEEKRMTEDEMDGCHHWLNGHESEQAPGVGDGQGSLACCIHGVTESRHDWATELNWRILWKCWKNLSSLLHLKLLSLSFHLMQAAKERNTERTFRPSWEMERN